MANNSKPKSKTRITKAQAAALLKMRAGQKAAPKAAPVDAEDMVDHGVDEASENDAPSTGKLKFGSPEWRAKYGNGKSKSKSVADALSVPGGK